MSILKIVISIIIGFIMGNIIRNRKDKEHFFNTEYLVKRKK